MSNLCVFTAVVVPRLSLILMAYFSLQAYRVFLHSHLKHPMW